MDITRHTTDLEQFRYRLYQNFDNRADTLMELVDALCSYPQADSVVAYSLSSLFRRSYSTISKALSEMRLAEMALPHLLLPHLPHPRQRPFWLLLLDVTPQPRPYAQVVPDRGLVYAPTVVKGNRPVTIGHEYASVALGLESEAEVSASWVLPLLTQRVASEADKELVGAAQIDALLTDPSLPFGQEFCVEVGDTSYSKPAYLQAHRRHPNLVTIARVRSNRTFYHPAGPQERAPVCAGHPTWYGEPFSLADPATWTTPDEEVTLWETSRRGKRQRVELQAWHNLLMRGKQKPQRLPMHTYPFTLVRIVRYDEEGNPLYKRPLWLLVMGDRRDELTLMHSYHAYAERFDLEHFFRFGKQKLSMAAFQTPDLQPEENWWQLTHIAYAQLWMARHVAEALPRPWERNLPVIKQRRLSPTLAQRDFGRIVQQLGTPAQPPKPRGIAPGRRKGAKLPKRPYQPVVVKRQHAAKAA
ncbi:MAG: hypothetical protein DCC55_41045 [Chloroflexi bacterium]|nr:MAG: hypothetical protein DCC55_41045 [Chloroflexota bacterium]